MSNGRANRAAQFNPFDALKGLQEALRKKEEISSRVEKRELSEEQQEALSSSLMRINQGTNVDITFFNKGHYISFYRHCSFFGFGMQIYVGESSENIF